MATTQQTRAPAPVPTKKAKGKKAVDPNDAKSQLAAKIAQLEQDAALDKEQEAEIEREVKKAMRDLNQLLAKIEDPLAKLDTVQKKYQELLHEMKRTEREHAKAKKKSDQLQKEKDNARSELTKAVSAKDKLEKMAREFQRNEKSARAELEKTKAEDQHLRDDMNERIYHMVAGVEEVIQSREAPQQPAHELEADELFREKFRSFIDQYEMREMQVSSLLRTKELEVEYLKAKMERQRKAQEMESSKSHQLTRQVSTFSQTESELRNQLNIYVEKFKQVSPSPPMPVVPTPTPVVEETLNNSNELFLTFRKEMEEMSKKTKRLEKENSNLTRKQEAASRSILEMAEDRSKRQDEYQQLLKKNANLEKLCRGMQAQGRGQMNVADVNDDVGTDSDYEGAEDEEYSDDDVYDDEETEEEGSPPLSAMEPRPKTYGPPPPPPTQIPPQAQHGRVNGHAAKQAKQVNGVKH